MFKAGIELELTRRENDDKVIALNVMMCEMMLKLKLCVLCLFSSFSILMIYRLKKITHPAAPGPEGTSIEDALKNRIMQEPGGILNSVEDCARLCDSYHKRHFASACQQAAICQIFSSSLTLPSQIYH